MTKTFATILAAAASATMLSPAVADAQTVSFAYKARELQTAGGRAAVIERVQRAAKRACMGTRTLVEIAHMTRCTRELGGDIVAQMKNPTMTALFLGKDEQIASR